MKDLATAVEGSNLIINALPRTLRFGLPGGNVDSACGSYEQELRL